MHTALSPDNGKRSDTTNFWYVPVAFFRQEDVADSRGVIGVQMGMHCISLELVAAKETAHGGRKRKAADANANIKPREAIKITPKMEAIPLETINQVRALTAEERAEVEKTVEASPKIRDMLTMQSTEGQKKAKKAAASSSSSADEVVTAKEWLHDAIHALEDDKTVTGRFHDVYVESAKQALSGRFKSAAQQKEPSYLKMVNGLPALSEALLDYALDPQGVETTSAQFRRWSESIPEELDDHMPTKMRKVYGRAADEPPPPKDGKKKGKGGGNRKGGGPGGKGSGGKSGAGVGGGSQAKTPASVEGPSTVPSTGASAAQIQSMSAQLIAARQQAQRYKRAMLNLQTEQSRWEGRWAHLCGWAGSLLMQLGTMHDMSQNAQMRTAIRSMMDNNAPPYNLNSTSILEPVAGHERAPVTDDPPGASQPSPLVGGGGQASSAPQGGNKSRKRT